MPEEEKKRELRKIDCHAGHVMASLVFGAVVALDNVCYYMQETTPYGEEYKRAFELHQSVRAMMGELEDALAACVEARKAKGGK